MELLAWHRIVIFFFVFFAILIYIKLSQIELFGRKAINLKNRILIAILFPLIFAIILIFSSIFLIVLIVFIITMIIIAILFSKIRIKK